MSAIICCTSSFLNVSLYRIQLFLLQRPHIENIFRKCILSTCLIYCEIFNTETFAKWPSRSKLFTQKFSQKYSVIQFKHIFEVIKHKESCMYFYAITYIRTYNLSITAIPPDPMQREYMYNRSCSCGFNSFFVSGQGLILTFLLY